MEPLEYENVANQIYIENSLNAPIKRSTVAVYADYVGYIPGIGTAVGILRMVSALAITIFTAIADQIRCCREGEHKQVAISIYDKAGIEGFRGVLELIPLFTLILDLNSSAEEDNYKYVHSNEARTQIAAQCRSDPQLVRNFLKIQGRLASEGFPRGRYIHLVTTAEEVRYTFFSRKEHTGSKMIIQQKWSSREGHQHFGLLVPPEQQQSQ